MLACVADMFVLAAVMELYKPAVLAFAQIWYAPMLALIVLILVAWLAAFVYSVVISVAWLAALLCNVAMLADWTPALANNVAMLADWTEALLYKSVIVGLEIAPTCMASYAA